MKPVDEKEKGLVDRARKGDEGAWNELVRRHRGPLDRWIFRSGVKTVEDRYDVAQNVWIKVHKGLRKFGGTAKFSTWLYKIARNCSFDHLRSIPPGVRQDQRVDTEEESQPRREQRDESTSSVENDYIAKMIVTKWLGEFQPAEHRETLWLHFVDGRGSTEIARMINESPQTVNNRIARALQKLQREMQRLKGQRR